MKVWIESVNRADKTITLIARRGKGILGLKIKLGVSTFDKNQSSSILNTYLRLLTILQRKFNAHSKAPVSCPGCDTDWTYFWPCVKTRTTLEPTRTNSRSTEIPGQSGNRIQRHFNIMCCKIRLLLSYPNFLVFILKTPSTYHFLRETHVLSHWLNDSTFTNVYPLYPLPSLSLITCWGTSVPNHHRSQLADCKILVLNDGL